MISIEIVGLFQSLRSAHLWSKPVADVFKIFVCYLVIIKSGAFAPNASVLLKIKLVPSFVYSKVQHIDS